jgi:integration host factor subunit alpha
MTGITLTRAGLAEAVHQEVGIPRADCRNLVDETLAQVSAALVLGKRVGISSFGSFNVVKRGQRIGRNPKTGGKVLVKPRRSLVFRASRVLKAKVRPA